MDKLIKAMLYLVIGGIIVSCAVKPKYLAPTDKKLLYGKRLTITQRKDAGFHGVRKTTTRVFGEQDLSGAGSFIETEPATGKGRMGEAKKLKLKDPGNSIASKLAYNLKQRYRLQTTGGSIKVINENVVEMSNKAAGSDYLLDIETINWGIDGYSSRLRLIDVKTSRLVAQGSCEFDADKQSSTAGFSRASLLANNGALLKKRLDEAKRFCIKRFIRILITGK